MTGDYQYTLEKGSKKHLCPGCSKPRLVRYVDTLTGEYLPEIYGRCDREANCGYHLNPYSDGYAKNQKSSNEYFYQKPKKRDKVKPVNMPPFILEKTLKPDYFQENTFIKNLNTSVSFPFDKQVLEKVCDLYQLGTITKGYRKGAVTFPFIDEKQNICTVQVKQFDQNNKTIKKGTDFLHAMLARHFKDTNQPLPPWLEAYLKNEKKVRCLFGAHLLPLYPDNTIALVEAPKTAVYATLYVGFPDNAQNFIWLANYNLSSFDLEKYKALKGRKVVLFPDLSKEGRAYQIWSEKAKRLSIALPGTFFEVSDFLETHANAEDRAKGLDLADFLIRLDWRAFRDF